LKLSVIFLLIISTPSALAETITFSDLGVATALTSGREANTPIGTFYTSSNMNSMDVVVNAYWKLSYRLTIYLNNAPLKSGDFGGEGNTLLYTISPENLRVGKNTIYIKGTSLAAMKTFGGSDGNLIIDRTSRISSDGIYLPPTPTPTPTIIIISPTLTTPIITPLITPTLTETPTISQLQQEVKDLKARLNNIEEIQTHQESRITWLESMVNSILVWIKSFFYQKN